jgi:hypothetical protein
MKSSSFDLEELNCWNKNLDVSLDALGCNLDSFLHKTYLLAKFTCHLRKIISPSYEIFFHLKCGTLIGLWVRNPNKLILHQMDFCSSRYLSQNGRRSTLADWDIWLWRLWFPHSTFSYFCCLICTERYGC